jgi:glycosyltransferase involved in cell wall biosynthesis
LWPASHQIAIDYIKYFHLDYVFISSSVVVQKFNHLMRDKKCYWIPEGINPDEYKFYPVEQRNIDVLAFGRKYQKYHEAIVNNLKEKRYNYLYEKNSGGLVFATKHEFIEGLARSKVSICVPHSLTNPDKAEDVETMTIRYLQSMASKCLIVGHAPAEMIELFGYNPVIEIDMNDPVNQLEHILENYLTYSGFIEKNYNEVIKNNTWMNRWNQIKSILLEKNN